MTGTEHKGGNGQQGHKQARTQASKDTSKQAHAHEQQKDVSSIERQKHRVKGGVRGEG